MDDNKETQYPLIKEHTLEWKILTFINHAIDYNSAGSNVDLKIQKENIKEILYQILSDPELIKVFDSTDSEFLDWDEVREKSVLVYSEHVYISGDDQQKLINKKHQFACSQIFTTTTGEEVRIGSVHENPEEKITALVLQKKRYY